MQEIKQLEQYKPVEIMQLKKHNKLLILNLFKMLLKKQSKDIMLQLKEQKLLFKMSLGKIKTIKLRIKRKILKQIKKIKKIKKVNQYHKLIMCQLRIIIYQEVIPLQKTNNLLKKKRKNQYQLLKEKLKMHRVKLIYY